MIRCVVFDFDGTLVRSDNIKRASFLAVVRNFDPHGELMARVLTEQPGDRHAIFKRFVEVTPAGCQASINAAGLGPVDKLRNHNRVATMWIKPR